jgi:hypothetical protein
MIRANLRLVVKIAREYEGLGLPLLDLINEGNIGLMKAVERFDPAKGGKLSTYSSWWINNPSAGAGQPGKNNPAAGSCGGQNLSSAAGGNCGCRKPWTRTHRGTNSRRN